MSSIHWQPERPVAAQSDEQSTVQAPQLPKLAALPLPLLDAFLRQTSPAQGQLPASLAQSLQTLLRQIPAVLLQNTPQATTEPSLGVDDTANGLQWLNRLLAPLIKLEPGLRLGSQVPTSPVQPQGSAMQVSSTGLSQESALLQLLQRQPSLGRALLQWTLQLMAQHPRLMAQLSPQEQHQFRQHTKTVVASQRDAAQSSSASPTNTALSPRQLLPLLKATLPLLQPSAAMPSKTPPPVAPQGNALSGEAMTADEPAPSPNASSRYTAVEPQRQAAVLLEGVKRLLQSQRLTSSPAVSQAAPAAVASPAGQPRPAIPAFTWEALLGLAGLVPDTPDQADSPLPPADSALAALPQLVRLLHSCRPQSLPANLASTLAQLTSDLQHPLDSPHRVEQWLRFMSAPLGTDTALGKGLQHWLVQLLSQRLAQAMATPGSSQSRNPPADESPVSAGLLHRLGTASLQLVEQRQGNQQETGASNLPWLCPLPPTPQRSHEPSLSIQRGGSTAQDYHWLLSFYLEPEGVGPLHIKVRLQLPDIGIMVIAEQAQGVDRVKATLPQLAARFADLGLQATGFHCRQGKVKPPQAPGDNTQDGLSIHI
ncbi:MAG: flagellar hook-length control protein FliK [Aeromonadaceae bacterium]|nr:flagellar hook-length control protein FliK [Aeromonadaceae bacterium]